MVSMHVLGTAVALAVAAVAFRVHAAVVTEDGYPIQWEKAPGQLSDLPQADGVTVVNPWNYPQRMSMYRLLLSSTQQYMSSMGPNATDSPLWGLPLQLGWKLKSGRLVDPTGASTCGQDGDDAMCISPQSWWACVNYYLSVIPFLAAVQKGIIGDGLLQVQIQGPSTAAEDYCTSFTDCSTKHPEMMSKWEAFFQGLKDVSSSEVMTDFEKRDKILGLMWAAQEESLLASNSCKDLLKHYASPEVAFGKSWINSAQYVGAAHFQSSIEKSSVFMTPLPSRVLKEEDVPPNIPDLSAEENHTLYIFGWMNTMNNFLGGSLVRMWRSAMCSETAREKGQALLRDLVLDPTFAASGLLSIITEMGSSC